MAKGISVRLIPAALLTLFFVTSLPTLSCAQDPSVEVNLDVLDEPFEPKQPEVETFPKRPLVPPLLTKTMPLRRPPVMLPEQGAPFPSLKVQPESFSEIPPLAAEKPPLPRRKPYRAVSHSKAQDEAHSRPAAAPVTPVHIIDPQQQANSAGIPTPRKRPTTMQASASFIKKARQDYNDAKTASAPPSPRPRTDDLMGSELETPTAREVLASIEKDSDSSNIISTNYPRGIQEVPQGLKEKLRKTIMKKHKAFPGARIEVRAFASPSPEEGQTGARRMSLMRAVDTRALLIEAGIDPAIVDIRALGANTEQEPMDRVDIVFVVNNG